MWHGSQNNVAWLGNEHFARKMIHNGVSLSVDHTVGAFGEI